MLGSAAVSLSSEIGVSPAAIKSVAALLKPRVSVVVMMTIMRRPKPELMIKVGEAQKRRNSFWTRLAS